MRYYSIILSDPNTNQVWVPPAFKSVFTDQSFGSYYKGQTLPGALNVEFDIPVSTFAVPMGAASVTIWGVSLQEIGQVTDLFGYKIQVYGGMQKGLPLAKPSQAGLLVEGYIWQAFANWIGTDMTLNLVINPAPVKDVVQPQFVFNWAKGASLQDAISQTLTAAYPTVKQSFNISANLVDSKDQNHTTDNFPEFCQVLQGITQPIIGGTYEGVSITLRNNTFYVYDGTVQTSSIQIAYEDMIGQPTWIESTTVSVKFVMRKDLVVGGYMKFPQKPLIYNTQTIAPTVNQRLTFQGLFLIQNVRHVGNFRQPDAGSWVTIVEAAAVNVQSA